MADYVSLAELKRHIGLQSYTSDQDTFLNEIRSQATDIVDRETQTWWDSRSKTVKTEATHSKQSRLFMPARVISLTSVKESGTTLAATEYKIYNTWIEKTNRSPWSMQQLDVEVVGSFGYATLPPEIVYLAKEIAAIISGLKVKTFVTNEGVEATVSITTLPEYVKQIIQGRKFMNLTGQVWVIT